jgi:hypothetical protein
MDSLKKELIKIDLEVLKKCIVDSSYIMEPKIYKKINLPGPEILPKSIPSIQSIQSIQSIPSIPSIPSINPRMYYKPVMMSDKRFDEIYDKILISYPNSCVLYINEVINETLENSFMKRFGSISSITPNAKILQLFHGTKNNFIDVIAENGFDPTLNRNAAFGYGVYFAKEANYSKDYMKSDEDITYMFLADVIVGRLTRGAQRITGENPVYNWDNNVDIHASPKIYTTPYPDGAYPRYIIAFHKNAK